MRPEESVETYSASSQRDNTIVTSLTDHRQSSTQGTDQTTNTITHDSALYTTIELSAIDINTGQLSSRQDIRHAADGFAYKHDYKWQDKRSVDGEFECVNPQKCANGCSIDFRC